MDEVADSNSVAPTIFGPLIFLSQRAFLCALLSLEFSSAMVRFAARPVLSVAALPRNEFCSSHHF